MMLKTKITNRRFYNKWLYKVTLNVPGIAIIRSRTLENTIEFLEDNTVVSSNNLYSVRRRAKDNAISIIKICVFLKNLSEDSWGKRIEQNDIDLYTNDVKIYNDLCNIFQNILKHNFEPKEGMIDKLDDQYAILVNNYPHKLYRYKVYLKPHRLKNDKVAKIQLVDWMSVQNNKILISDSVKSWFIDTEWNWDRRYVLVTDSNTLLMLKLRSCDVIGKVYEYKIIDK
jgi:hypothetical protein